VSRLIGWSAKPGNCGVCPALPMTRRLLMHDPSDKFRWLRERAEDSVREMIAIGLWNIRYVPPESIQQVEALAETLKKALRDWKRRHATLKNPDEDQPKEYR
jgi:hypothetical protein